LDVAGRQTLASQRLSHTDRQLVTGHIQLGKLVS
jgi:hypothetical protein